eukprot:scaffold18463_cov66-Isochrysis_galbana.AAC.1
MLKDQGASLAVVSREGKVAAAAHLVSGVLVRDGGVEPNGAAGLVVDGQNLFGEGSGGWGWRQARARARARVCDASSCRRGRAGERGGRVPRAGSGARGRATPLKEGGTDAHFEAVLIPAEDARLTPTVARAAAPHDTRLDEDARAAVRVRPLLARDGGEGDGVLVVVRQVEVAREPALDAAAEARGEGAAWVNKWGGREKFRGEGVVVRPPGQPALLLGALLPPPHSDKAGGLANGDGECGPRAASGV